MREITLDYVKELLVELDPTLEGKDEEGTFRAGLVLLSALTWGPDTGSPI